jgi:hypothetical protein
MSTTTDKPRHLAPVENVPDGRLPTERERGTKACGIVADGLERALAEVYPTDDTYGTIERSYRMARIAAGPTGGAWRGGRCLMAATSNTATRRQGVHDGRHEGQ